MGGPVPVIHVRQPGADAGWPTGYGPGPFRGVGPERPAVLRKCAYPGRQRAGVAGRSGTTGPILRDATMNPPRTVDPDPEHPVTGRIDHPAQERTRPSKQDAADGAVPSRSLPDMDDLAVPAQLIIVRGKDAGTRFPITEAGVSIGRHRDCDIVLDDITVSRNHAELHHDGRRYTIDDAGSLNGTYVNQRPVEDPTELADGDEVRIGTFRLAFRVRGS
ncbi:hypothetical protein GTS_14370 [Gandjariella thermophila]|uniref:FHA domain-containing protein n=2 Tax=Gandjariella thermophila TaxID=1931992 RepID=A0A4D4J2Z2_9PSEU|nr:hypothetical protein GTS_14370 [Gandjariella thermophila]